MKRILILALALQLGPMAWGTAPALMSNGAGVNGTGSLSVPYPGGERVGDRIILHLFQRTSSDTATTPTGFALLFSDTINVGADIVKQIIYCRDADGTESGNLTLTITSGAVHVARTYLFRYAAACASISEASGTASNVSATVNAVAITTTGADRLAVAFVGRGGSGVPASPEPSFTGETGGDWITQPSYVSPPTERGMIQLQAAVMPIAATISGGSYTTGGVNLNINRSFAMLPDPAPPPENTGLAVFPIQLLPFTHQQIFTSSGTWSRPLNVDLVYVRVQAPGGGGGGGQGAQGVGDDPGGGGAGAGSGQIVQDFVAVFGDVAVTINPAGTGGLGSAADAVSAPGNNGTDGGTASFGSLVAQGGKGGEGGHLVADAVGGSVVPIPTPGGTGTASDSLPVQFFAMRGERGFQGGQGARVGTSVQTAGASSTLFVGGAVGTLGPNPAVGTGAGGGASTDYGVGGQGGNGGNNTHFAGFPGQDGQGAGSGGGGGGGGATWSVGGAAADGADGGDGVAGRVEVYW